MQSTPPLQTRLVVRVSVYEMRDRGTMCVNLIGGEPSVACISLRTAPLEDPRGNSERNCVNWASCESKVSLSQKGPKL